MRDWLAIRRTASPGTTALVDDETDRAWTYRELDAEVEELSGVLAGVGVEAGDRVGVLMETRPAFVRLLWAIQRRGATMVPFNARLTAGEVSEQVDRIDPAVVVTEAATEETAVAAAASVRVLTVDEPAHSDVRAIASVSPASHEGVEMPLDETMVVMFTSGTTGSPKAVRVTGQNFLASAVATAFRLGVRPDDRWLLCLPMYHMGGLSIPIRTTVYGTTTVLQRGFDEAAVHRAMAARDVTGVSLVPTMLDRLLDEGPIPDSLRFALVGGGPTPTDLVERARDAGVPIYPTYGMTETASQITTATPDDVDEAPGTVGRPLEGTEVAILDDDGNRVPTGEIGSIAVDGFTVSPGYLGEPARDPTDDESTWFRTGDEGYLDESGRLYVEGRASDRIVTGGENVSPAEVVAAIRAHPAVEDAVVVGISDPEWGERVAALVVSTDALDAADLRSFLEGRLAGYKVPRVVAFVDELPRTPSGTVDREAARARLRNADA